MISYKEREISPKNRENLMFFIKSNVIKMLYNNMFQTYDMFSDFIKDKNFEFNVLRNVTSR